MPMLAGSAVLSSWGTSGCMEPGFERLATVSFAMENTSVSRPGGGTVGGGNGELLNRE